MWNSLGIVLVASNTTPVIATINQTTPTASYPCHSMLFQQVQTNTGKIYICDRSNANITTGVGVLYVLPIPTLDGGVAAVLPSATVSVPTANNAIDAHKIWIAADNNNDKCLVSAIVV